MHRYTFLMLAGGVLFLITGCAGQQLHTRIEGIPQIIHPTVNAGTQVGNWVPKLATPLESLNHNYKSGVGAPAYVDVDGPALAFDGNTVYAAFKENYLWREYWPIELSPASPTDHEPIRVRRFDGTTWVEIGADLNTPTSATGTGSALCGSGSGNSAEPAIAVSSGGPYVAFIENVSAACTVPVNHQLFVKHYNTSSGQWVSVGGGSIPMAAGHFVASPLSNSLSDRGKLYDLTIHQGIPYVAYIEETNAPSSYSLILKYWTANMGWVQIGGAISVNSSAIPQDPSLQFFSAPGAPGQQVPYIAWREGGHLYVKRVRVDAVYFSAPAGAALGPHSAWEWAGQAAAPDLRNTSSGQVATLSLASTPGSLVIAWSEKNAAIRVNQAGHTLQCTEVYVKRFDTGTGTWRRLQGITTSGSTGALTSACADNWSPYIDTKVAIGKNDIPYTATAVTDYRNGGLKPSAAQVEVRYWLDHVHNWSPLAGSIDKSQNHNDAETDFYRVAVAIGSNGYPWVGWIRHHVVPNDPYGVVRPADQFYVNAFE